ncbi:MAG: DNA-processing protein DprA [Ruminococcus sp.]|nr:DNA-processing protein DprA [Ruminococcus sp.]
MAEIKYWLWLAMVFGPGSRRIWETISFCGTAMEAYFYLTTDGSAANLTDAEKRAIDSTDLSKAAEHIEFCRRKGISLVSYDSKDYPPQLRHIYDPPAVLYYRGNISCLKGTRTVTTVGTRHATNYGLEAAHRVCADLARNGFVIVSGFALGSDIATHMAAVSVNRPTACVLGCGVDVDYPRDNVVYRDRILNCGGVFISEYPPGTRPLPQNFPKRNRILAALGMVTVVFEASARSGSLITADLAATHGREVFSLPPADIFSKAFSGNIELLRWGATPLYSIEDVMECFLIGGALDEEIRSEQTADISTFGYESSLRTDRDDPLEEIKATAGKVRPRRQKAKTGKKSPEIQEEIKDEKNTFTAKDELTELQRTIFSKIKNGTAHADALAQELGMDSDELMTELTELEILGAVRSLPGKMYEIL